MEEIDARPRDGDERSKVRPLFRPFDPSSREAEDHYDTVVQRVNRTRRQRTLLEREKTRLENQFVGNDLTVLSGPRRGEPLSRAGRRRRLERLVEVAVELARVSSEERFANGCLDRMNAELDRWARETYQL